MSKDSIWSFLLLYPVKILGAVCLLFISSAVSMAVPFSLGKVLDIIYTGTNEVEETRRRLNNVCGVLVIIFILGAIANFGRVYIMSTSGTYFSYFLHLWNG